MTRLTVLVTAAFGIVLLFAGAFATHALAAGSDVVHYPTVEAYRSETIEQRYDIGVPVPRLRAFDKASWAPSRVD